MKDVAKMAGVSPSTVSRVINNSAYVNNEKKKKVFEIIEELNYRPDFSGKSLKKGNTNIIAVVLPNLYNPYYAKLSQSLERYVNKNNYLMLLALSNDKKELEKKYLEEFTYGIADGIILIPSKDTIHIKEINKNFPIVIINREVELFNHVTLDNEKAAYNSVEYLIKKGHEKIICYIGDITNPIYKLRKQGCIKAFVDNNIEYDETNFIENITDVGLAYKTTNIILDSGNHPTAIFSTMDLLVSGIYSSITEHELNIPKDISVMGFDNNLFTENFIPPLTTYNHPTDLTAQHAIELVVNQIKEDSKKDSIIIDGEVLERDSVLNLKNEDNNLNS